MYITEKMKWKQGVMRCCNILDFSVAFNRANLNYEGGEKNISYE